jgi:hypothetical protein
LTAARALGGDRGGKRICGDAGDAAAGVDAYNEMPNFFI